MLETEIGDRGPRPRQVPRHLQRQNRLAYPRPSGKNGQIASEESAPDRSIDDVEPRRPRRGRNLMTSVVDFVEQLRDRDRTASLLACREGPWHGRVDDDLRLWERLRCHRNTA